MLEPTTPITHSSSGGNDADESPIPLSKEGEKGKPKQNSILAHSRYSTTEDIVERSLEGLMEAATQLRGVLSPVTEKVFPLRNVLAALLDDMRVLQRSRLGFHAGCTPRAIVTGGQDSWRSPTMNFLLNKEAPTVMESSTLDSPGVKSQNKSISFADDEIVQLPEAAPPLVAFFSKVEVPPATTTAVAHVPSPPLLPRKGKETASTIANRFSHNIAQLGAQNSPLSLSTSPGDLPLVRESTNVFPSHPKPLTTFSTVNSSSPGHKEQRARRSTEMKRSSPSTRTARGVGGLRKKSVTISPGVLGPTIVELLSKAAVPGGVYAFIGERLEKPIAGEGIGCMFVSREVAPSRSGSLVSRIGKSSSSGVPQVFLALNSTPPDPSLLELTLEGETNTGHDEDGSSSTDYSCPHTPLLTPPEAPWVLQETDECAIRWEEGTTPLIPVAALGDAIFFCVSVFDLIKGQWGFLSLLFPPFMLGGTEKESAPADNRQLLRMLRQRVVAQTFFIITGIEFVEVASDPGENAPDKKVLEACLQFIHYMELTHEVTVHLWQLIPFNNAHSRLTRDFLTALYTTAQATPATLSPLHRPHPPPSPPNVTADSLQTLTSPNTRDEAGVDRSLLTIDPISPVLPRSIFSPNTSTGSFSRQETRVSLFDATENYCNSIFGPEFRNKEAFKKDRNELVRYVYRHALQDMWYRSGAYYLCKLAKDFERQTLSYILSQAATSLMMWCYQLLQVLPVAAETSAARVKSIYAKIETYRERRLKVEESISHHRSVSPQQRVTSLENKLQEVFSGLSGRFLGDLRTLLVNPEEPKELKLDVNSSDALLAAYRRLAASAKRFRAFFSEQHKEKQLFLLNLRIQQTRSEMETFVQNYTYFTLLNGTRAKEGEVNEGYKEAPQYQDLEDQLKQLFKERHELESELLIHVSLINTEIINYFIAVCVQSMSQLHPFLVSEFTDSQRELKHVLKSFAQTKPPKTLVNLDEIYQSVKACNVEKLLYVSENSELHSFVTALRAALCEDQVRALARFNTALLTTSSSPPAVATTPAPRRTSGVGSKVNKLNTTEMESLFSAHTPSYPKDFFASTGAATTAPEGESTKKSASVSNLSPTRLSLPEGSEENYFLSYRVERMMQKWCRRYNQAHNCRRREDGEESFLLSDVTPVTFPSLPTPRRRQTVGIADPLPPLSANPTTQERQDQWRHVICRWREETDPALRPTFFNQQPMLWILLDVWEETLLGMPYQPWMRLAAEQYGECIAHASLELLEAQHGWSNYIGELIDDLEMNGDALDREALRLSSTQIRGSALATVQQVWTRSSDLAERLCDVRHNTLRYSVRTTHL